MTKMVHVQKIKINKIKLEIQLCVFSVNLFLALFTLYQGAALLGVALQVVIWALYYNIEYGSWRFVRRASLGCM